MSRGFVKALRTSFTGELAATLPMFRKMTSGADHARGVIFEAPVKSDLGFFIYVSPAKTSEAFTLELAWNRPHVYPFRLMPLPVVDSTMKYDPRKLAASSFRTRIANLLGERRTVWWRLGAEPTAASLAAELLDLGPTAELNVTSAQLTQNEVVALSEAVLDGCQKLLDVGLPCFSAVAAAHHSTFP
jgi:hypothetical protein